MVGFKITFICSLVVAFANAMPQQNFQDDPFDPHPVYTYNYQVADDVSQNYITKKESRDGDQVTGEYSYVDPTGSLITVRYRAGPMGYTEERDVQENFVAIQTRGSSSQSSSTSSNRFSSSASSTRFGSSSSGSSTRFGSSSSRFGSSSTTNNVRSRPSTSSIRSQSSVSQGTSSLENTKVQEVIEKVEPAVEEIVTTSTSSIDSSDLVAKIIAQLTPLIRQTVNSSLKSQERKVTTVTRQIVPSTRLLPIAK